MKRTLKAFMAAALMAALMIVYAFPALADDEPGDDNEEPVQLFETPVPCGDEVFSCDPAPVPCGDDVIVCDLESEVIVAELP
jgi:hypothetical protein